MSVEKRFECCSQVKTGYLWNIGNISVAFLVRLDSFKLKWKTDLPATRSSSLSAITFHGWKLSSNSRLIHEIFPCQNWKIGAYHANLHFYSLLLSTMA